ncbi:hypothetical protein EPUS_01321 [Endocarpon pusillum Z07020]|uniref:DUF7707 domain-containing protein n=1 Tax=Endocarpon pusillum (strain Z07020 / HMAS-L-300199) TaxID=1263415 RepID=U1HYK1_ENDPU|nr:uncharacterized protein EPUS_01321 [Endocarpon pusillum Z07020]ERF75955.1 hypothetical protein EPUS_01321 [Endocarpon pusillum Z07020]
MRSGLVAAASAALVTSVAAQASTTISQSMPPTATAGFNSAPIPRQQRFQWCLGQRNACPQICGGSATTNNCEENDLTYSCVCSNGTVPDVSAYRDTLPFYICTETFNQCIAAHPDDAEGQDTCQENQRCGTLNATAVESSSSDSSASSATSATSASTVATSTSAASGSASAASTASAAPTNAAVTVSQQISTTALAALFMTAFKLFL